MSDGAQEIESPARYNGPAHLAATGTKSQDETRLPWSTAYKTDRRHAKPPSGCGWNPSLMVHARSAWRWRTRSTLLEGAVLTVLIVFLFLNSWRSTVITGLTLPIALVGTFLVMYAFGFTINMITLMALSPAGIVD